MNTLGPLNTWLNLLSNEISDLAVSKHSNHSKDLSALILHLLDYAEPTQEYMKFLYSDGVNILTEEAEIEAENRAIAAATIEEEAGIHEDEENNSSCDCHEEEDSDDLPNSKLRTRTISLGSRLSHLIRPAKEGSSFQVRGTSQVQLSGAILPSACQNIPISFLYARPFLSNNSIRYLSMLIDGDESLEVKGIKYCFKNQNIVFFLIEKIFYTLLAIKKVIFTK